MQAIVATASSLAQNPIVRAAVISGSGRVFSAGLDIKSCASNGPSVLDELLVHRNEQHANLAQAVGYAWRQCPFPVVAALHGVCFGGGLQIALGADIRVAGSACKLSVLEAKWGLIPDMSGSITLREVCPIDTAKSLSMTAEIFSAEKAAHLGIVDEVADDPQTRAVEIAQGLVAGVHEDPAAVKQRLLNDRADRFRLSVEPRTAAVQDITVTTSVRWPQSKSNVTIHRFDGGLGPSFPVLSLGCSGGKPDVGGVSFDAGVARGVVSTCMLLAADPSIRGVVVETHGGASWLWKRTAAAQTGDEASAAEIAEVADAFRMLPVPVVAVVDGALGPAASRAVLGADLRFGSASSSFVFGRDGDEHAPTAVDHARAGELGVDLASVVQQRDPERIIGKAAARIGLMTSLSENPLLEARKFSKLIKSKSPDSVAATKALFNRTWHAAEYPSLVEETELQQTLFFSYNQIVAASRNVPLPFQLPYLKRKLAWL
jgi:enoyl-CoA hydratase/carnithine racemase